MRRSVRGTGFALGCMSMFALAAMTAPARADDCGKLQAWVAEAPVPTQQFTTYGRASESVMALIGDARFKANFGLTYDRMPAAELQRWNNLLPACFAKQGPLGPLDTRIKDAVYSVFSARAFGTNSAQLAKSRVAAGDVLALVQEADQLPVDQAGYERYAAIRDSGPAVLPGSAPETRAAFAAALERGEQRVIIPVERARVDAVIASAAGYEGMVALVNMLDSGSDRDASPALRSARANNDARLAARIPEIAVPVAAAERQRIDAFGSGLAGLEQGVQWSRDFAARLAPYAGRSPDIAALPRYLAQRRGPILQSAVAPMQSLIVATRGEDELMRLLGSYLLSTDSSTAPGASILEMAGRQSAYLKKRDIIGEQMDAERAARYPGGANPSAAPLARLTGEPTSENIYDALQGQYDAEDSIRQSVNQGCRHGGANTDLASLGLCTGLEWASMLGMSDTPVTITRFRKLRCVSGESSGKLGYICAYEISRSGGEVGGGGAVLNAAVAAGVFIEESRFILSEDGTYWMLLAQDVAGR